MTIRKLAPFISVLVLSPVLQATQAHAAPTAGTRELRLGQQYVAYLAPQSGFAHFEGEDNTTLGLGAGFGHFLTDHLELGVSANLTLQDDWFGEFLKVFGVEPFIRFMHTSGRIGYFAELVTGFQRYSVREDGTTLLDVGFDLGVELFVTDLWSVRLAPNYRRLFDLDSDDTSWNRFGVSWGLACYF
jgi:hypothetical protein